MGQDKKYNIIIAGGGFAGLTAAIIASRHTEGVILLDRNTARTVGKKTSWGWVCGDAIGKPHIDFLENKIGTTMGKPEVERDFHAVFAVSPDLSSRFKFDGDGYALDRPMFESRLLEIALKSGVDYQDSFEIDGPIMHENKVTGIYGRDIRNKTVIFESNLVIDALGISSVLRRKLPENRFVDRDINRDDIILTGRYIYQYDTGDNSPNFFDRSNALIHLNNDIAPGGYAWVFPKGENRVNIGLGVQKAAMNIRNSKLGANDTVNSLLDRYVAMNPGLKNLRVFNRDQNGVGYWTVSVRRQLDSLVFNGYMGAGDSVAMANPLSAAGIGPAIISGALAAENACHAIENHDTSINGLWNYNIDYNQAYGNRTGGLEIFRIYLQSLTNRSLNYGMRKFLTPEEASEIAFGGIPKLSAMSKIKFIMRGLGDVRAFRALVHATQQMKTMDELYRNYPDTPEEFSEFSARVRNEVAKAKSMFRPMTL